LKQHRVIHQSCLPTRLNLGFIPVYWMLLDRLKAPEWAFGVFWTVTVILVAAMVLGLYREKQVKLTGFGTDE
jgi:hypothetical protein